MTRKKRIAELTQAGMDGCCTTFLLLVSLTSLNTAYVQRKFHHRFLNIPQFASPYLENHHK